MAFRPKYMRNINDGIMTPVINTTSSVAKPLRLRDLAALLFDV